MNKKRNKKNYFSLVIITMLGIITFHSVSANAFLDRWSEEQIQFIDPSACDPTGGGATTGASAANPSGTTGKKIKTVYMRGDSITLRADRSGIAAKFGAKGITAKISSGGGTSVRRSQPGLTNGLDDIDANKNKVKDVDAVVIALGTNTPRAQTSRGGVSAKAYMQKDIGLMIDKVKSYNPNAKIFWVNVMNNQPGQAANVHGIDAAIQEGASSKGYTVIDAFSHTKDIVFEDGLHPAVGSRAAQGIDKWDKLVVDGASSGTPSESGAAGQSAPATSPTNSSDSPTQCTCPSQSSNSSSSAAGSSDKLNIKDIAQKYHLQSAMIQELNSGVVAEYNSDKPPNTPASSMKLIIADTALRTGIDLNKTVSVSSDVYYDGANDLGSNRTSLKNAFEKMLVHSSNVGPNVLMKALGGVDGFTKKAHKFGYSHTTVKGYYDPSNNGKNTSTISDQVAAMVHIFKSKVKDYSFTQDALKNNDNHFQVDAEAHKAGWTDNVASNVGLIKSGDKSYIIGLYINHSVAPSKDNDVAKATAELAKAAKSGGTPGSAGASGSQVSGSCACSETTTLTGSDNPQKVWNFFKGKGLSDNQIAGIMGNLNQESGFIPQKIQGGGLSKDPHDSGGNGWGIIQWTPGSKIISEAQQLHINDPIYELATQLNIVWGSMEGKIDITKHFDLQHFKGLHTALESAQYFGSQIEGFGVAGGRFNNLGDFINKYGGSSSGSTQANDNGGGCSSAGTGSIDGEPGSVDAAVSAAKLLSGFKVGYIWGGSHGPGDIKTTDADKLIKQGTDCSSSVAWVLYHAGMLDKPNAPVSGDLESWGKAGKGNQMTVWASADHVFIEFNLPGVGHYRLDTSQHGGTSKTPGAIGPGPRFVPWGSRNTNGFTPRHWQGT